MATPKPGRETPSGRWANWTPPTSDRKHADDTRPQNLDELIEQMDRTPDGNIAMCHAQGKTAVYVSEDRQYIIEHPPHGPITRRPRDPGVPRQP